MKPKTTGKKAPVLCIAAEERYHLINDAAYFRSLQRRNEAGHFKDEAESWCAVEAEIDDVLTQHHMKPPSR